MKSCKRFLLMLLLLARLSPQILRADPTLQTLYIFPQGSTNCSGPSPQIIEGVDGNFYGTTLYGLSNACGTVFKMTQTGVLSVLCSFSGTNGQGPFSLTQCPDGNFYGVTMYGGDYFDSILPSWAGLGDGTIFKMNPNGAFTTMYYFNSTNGNGSLPFGPLVLGNDGNLYGITEFTGSVFPYDSNNKTGFGTVFQITTNGVLTTLHTFDGTNGSAPTGGLTLAADGSFYGVTKFGGNGFQSEWYSGNGTIFKITTNGTFTTLIYFNGTNGLQSFGGLTVGNDGNFYGTTSLGGSDYTGVPSSGSGTVFKLTTNGVLTSFSSFNITNGTRPESWLTQGQDGNFYGTTIQNGNTNLNNGYGYGTIFVITPQGAFTRLAVMDGTNGASPIVDMILSQDGNIYGTMSDAHYNYFVNGGTFFRLASSPGIASIANTNCGVTVSWTSLTNRCYRIDYKSSLAEANWTALATNVAIDITTSFTDTSTYETTRFYRVVLLP
jgi:uncharacterized repeat protein (TIGR03803 family)